MPYPVTKSSIDGIMQMFGLEYRGEWQHEIIAALCDNYETVVQGPRQVTGKTFCVAMFEGARIAAGHTVTVGYPTLTQATRLLSERIIGNVDRFGRILEQESGKKFWKRPKEQATYRRWIMNDMPNHEGKLYVLSANEIAVKVPEGYTTADLDLDESHRLTQKTLGIFEPFTDVALKEGNAHIVYIGVGGHKNSLIEQKKGESGVKVVRYTASMISEIAPEWIPVFEKRRKSLPPWQYRSHYECEQSAEGMRLMYPEPAPEVDVMDYVNRNIKGLYYFGIDVGRMNDSTIIHVLLRYGDKVNSIATHEVQLGPFQEQAAQIHAWIDKTFYWSADRITVETNGLGIGLYDALNVDGLLRGLNGVHTDETLKNNVWEESVVAIQNGQYGIKDERYADEIGGLSYNTRERDGKIEIEHSDHWMAFAMAWVTMDYGDY